MRARINNITVAATVAIFCMLAGASSAYASFPLTATDSTTATVQLQVSLHNRALQVRMGDSLIASYDVAIGKSKHPTPTGVFRVERIIWNPSWTPPPNAAWARGKKPKKPGDPNNPMGRVKIFFAEPDYYIHGTNQEESIGTAASHGCIRMRNEDAIALAKLVMEHAGETRPAEWFDEVLGRATRSEEVRLASPLPIRIQRTNLAAGSR